MARPSPTCCWWRARSKRARLPLRRPIDHLVGDLVVAGHRVEAPVGAEVEIVFAVRRAPDAPARSIERAVLAGERIADGDDRLLAGHADRHLALVDRVAHRGRVALDARARILVDDDLGHPGLEGFLVAAIVVPEPHRLAVNLYISPITAVADHFD